MSTRAMYTFIGDKSGRSREQFHVYKHHDGYPINGTSGAVFWLKAALDYAWPLPRYEADDFAAAFVAANKSSGESLRTERLATYRQSLRRAKKNDEDTSYYEKEIAGLLNRTITPGGQGGGIRLMQSGPDWRTIAPWDIAYRYEVEHTTGENDLTVRAYSVSFDAPDQVWSSGVFKKEYFSQELLFTTGLRHADVQAKLWQVQDELAA